MPVAHRDGSASAYHPPCDNRHIKDGMGPPGLRSDWTGATIPIDRNQFIRPAESEYVCQCHACFPRQDSLPRLSWQASKRRPGLTLRPRRLFFMPFASDFDRPRCLGRLRRRLRRQRGLPETVISPPIEIRDPEGHHYSRPPREFRTARRQSDGSTRTAGSWPN